MPKTLLRIAVATFAALVIQSPSSAQEITCTGQSLLPELNNSHPKLAGEMRVEASSTPFGEGLLWKLKKPGIRPSYLFGTIHLADPRLLEMKPGTRQAFDESRLLALEVTEILDPAKMAGAAFSMLKYTSYSGNESLDDKLDSEQKRKVSDAAREKLGLPWVVVRKMKPWAIMGTLALPACEMQRKRAQKPVVDVNLGQMAKAQGKQIVALETMVRQNPEQYGFHHRCQYHNQQNNVWDDQT